MKEGTQNRVFEHCFGWLAGRVTARLAARLASIEGLSAEDISIISGAARDSLLHELHRKLARLLLVELNIAREEGRLEGASAAERWSDFITTAATELFWNAVFEQYPSLDTRLSRLCENHLSAIETFARHWVAGRSYLERLLGCPPTDLRAIQFGQGDLHRGGRSVALVTTDCGKIVYKPRSLAIDVTLNRFLDFLSESGGNVNLKVARAIDCGDHGWAGWVSHQYCADTDQLVDFYTGIGQALAIMRLLGGTDLHAENMIAHGASPVIIDCETLFTPSIRARPSRYGKAYDQSVALISASVLAIGLLPDRAQGLGWRGIDMSGVGGLPDQQPDVVVPGIVGAGTDNARIAMVSTRPPRARNHPAETPRLFDFWNWVLLGFDKTTAKLRQHDADGTLSAMLASFADCSTRAVVRPTETYAELGRMLWHPASLTDEPAAISRARDVLAAMGTNFSYAPDDPIVIDAEISDLLVGDIPIFTTTPRRGALDGPQNTTWLSACNRIEQTLCDWRNADDEAERGFVQATLVSAYVNDGHVGDGVPRRPTCIRRDALEIRRQAQAARLIDQLMQSAHLGGDNTVCWAAPALLPTGWAVQPTGPDLYAGLSGIALVTGAYVREMSQGRAAVVEGVEDIYRRALASLRHWEAEQSRERLEGLDVRPPPVGGYVGLGSQIWARLALYRMGMDDDSAIDDALGIARGIDWAEWGDDRDDLLYGRAGAIPPLLQLAALSGDTAPFQTACRLGRAICKAAKRSGNNWAWWTHDQFPTGLGGFAHGASGIGWALSRLAAASAEEEFAATAKAAFEYEDSLWVEGTGWRDLRALKGVPTSSAWCHGAVGIGLARIGADPEFREPTTARTLTRSLDIMSRSTQGWNHCLCHGDFGAWELFDEAAKCGRLLPAFDADENTAEIISGLEEHGAICGVAGHAAPGLFTGFSGVIYQLLRMHPDALLPSVMMLG